MLDREIGLAAERVGRRVEVALRQRAVGPGQRLLDVRLGIAHQLVQEAQGGRDELGAAAGAPVAVGHRRDRRTDQPPLPAGRGVDQLLELGPAVGLGGDPDPVWMGQVVDRHPVIGLASRPAEQLPGSLRFRGEGPLEQPEGKPAGLEVGLAEEAIGDEQQRRGGVAPRFVAEATGDRGQQRPPDAEDRADTGGDKLHAFLVLGVGEPFQPASQRRCERVRVADQLRQVEAERLGVGLVGGHEFDGALGRGAGACGCRRHRATPAGSGREASGSGT